MIVRGIQVEVFEGKEAEFARFFTETAIPLMRSQDGLVRLIPGLPRPESPNKFSMTMVWRDLDALIAFAGEDWAEPHVDPIEADLVKFRMLHHYDLADGEI